MPSESCGRLVRLGRRRIIEVHDLPPSVALKPDIEFLKVLIPYYPFSAAGFDALEATRNCAISARVYLHVHIGQLNRLNSPTTPDESSLHFLVLGFPFPPATSARRTAGPGFDRSESTQRCSFACSFPPSSSCGFSSTTTPAQLGSFDRSPGRCRRLRRHRSSQW